MVIVCRCRLAYKTVWHGSHLLGKERFYPSSRTYSRCGAVEADLPAPALLPETGKAHPAARAPSLPAVGPVPERVRQARTPG